MKLVEKILVPTDFHGSANRSIDMAIDMAKKFNSEIILLHVLKDNPELREFEDIIKQEVDRQFQDIQAKISDNGLTKVSQVIENGTKFDKIVQVAEELDVNLILMGSGEKTSEKKYRLGTTTKRVIELSTKPVWVMTEQSTQSVKTIVCPVDFSGPSRRALNNALHLSRYFKAELRIMTVNESLKDLLDGLEVKLDNISDTAYKEIDKQFDKFLEAFDFHDVNWKKEIHPGKPHAEILKAIEGRADETLLVMGTTGKTGLSRILIGSVTEKVIRELPCSFVTMKEEDIIVIRLNSDLQDIETHFKQGIELLANGLPKEALSQFRMCLSINDLHAGAWDGMATAYRRLRREEEAENCEASAKEIRNRMEHQKIEAEIRGKHWMVKGQ
ncbi:MAG TPA: universal stress protein [Cyclobacteriaceae bacterium]